MGGISRELPPLRHRFASKEGSGRGFPDGKVKFIVKISSTKGVLKIKNCLLVCLGIIIFILTLLGFLVYYFGFSMSRLPEGEFLKQVDSPDKTYTIKFYLIDGGATTSYAIRGELINNQKKSKRGKNIYWDYKVYDVNVVWLDNNTVVINGHKLNIKKDIYDWRRSWPPPS